MLIDHANIQKTNTTSEKTILDIQNKGFSMIDGETFIETLGLNKKQLEMFSFHWFKLILDEYMADGGLYRYRRYGQFSVDSSTGKMRLMPHEPYIQPSHINKLNGGVQRLFKPLESTFVKSIVLKKVLGFLMQVYNKVLNQSVDWNIGLHPYRVIASDEITGLPTPEGLHRDGVTFVASLLINRKNISGGTTTITNSNKHILDKCQLTTPFDLLMADDTKTMHEVSSLRVMNKQEEAYRDVLVIAFTKSSSS